MTRKWRTGYDTAQERDIADKTGINFEDWPTKTIEAPAEEHDINIIMRNFGVRDGSILPYWHSPAALYGDRTTMPSDPVEIAEVLRQGNLAYMQLPAEVRRKFDSAEQMFQWMSDSKNKAEAQRLGLLAKDPITKPKLSEEIAKAITDTQKKPEADAPAPKNT